MDYPVFNFTTTYADGNIVTYEGQVKVFYRGKFYNVPDGITDPDKMLDYAKKRSQMLDNFQLKED